MKIARFIEFELPVPRWTLPLVDLLVDFSVLLIYFSVLYTMNSYL